MSDPEITVEYLPSLRGFEFVATAAGKVVGKLMVLTSSMKLSEELRCRIKLKALVIRQQQ